MPKAGRESVRVPGGGKGNASSDRASSFTGDRISRGYAQRAVLAGRGKVKGLRQGVINVRIVRIKASDLGCSVSSLMP
ncbi:hypothetical protein ACVIGB_004312 [Bradyrhizobium sp. USDA 4341]